MALPWLTLTLAYVGEFYLVMRSSLLDTLGEEYIALARAKGVREKYVLRKHAVPNALLPTITLVALSFGFILSGVITIESSSAIPASASCRSTPSPPATSRCCKRRSSSP